MVGYPLLFKPNPSVRATPSSVKPFNLGWDPLQDNALLLSGFIVNLGSERRTSLISLSIEGVVSKSISLKIVLGPIATCAWET